MDLYSILFHDENDDDDKKDLCMHAGIRNLDLSIKNIRNDGVLH